MTISIKPTASGSTIEQDGSTILTVDGSGNISIANDLSVTGTAPIPDALSTAIWFCKTSYSARAWVNFNGTGTVAIRALVVMLVLLRILLLVIYSKLYNSYA